MEWSSYSDPSGPDYAFGQRMLTLRTTLRLTQARLAEYLGVSRRAVVKWESGNRYPTAEHLKHYIEFAVQQGAFPEGRENDEIRSLWQASHQKVLLDDSWVASLLRTPLDDQTETTDQIPPDPGPSTVGGQWPVPAGPRLDWGDALSVSTFYGRTWELDFLTQWTVEERCRVVSVLGLGGIGKSALAVNLMHRVASQFDMVIWRSLRDAPSIEAFVEDCLRVAAPQAFSTDVDADAGSPASERHLNTLLGYMRDTRLLLVLDNLETILEEGVDTGQVREGYEGFSRLLRLVAETEHRSCLLFTSREKPTDLGLLEGTHSPVRTLRIARLGEDACEALLAEKGVKGSATERASLIEAYAGNPLALKIVAQTIVDLFGGEPGPFLKQGGVIFGGVRALLAEQFNRLSPLEQRIMVWLAILREPANLEELRALFVTRASPAQLLEAVEALRRRSLIERGQQGGSFTLQSVVLEYGTSRLIANLSREIQHGRLERAAEHGLSLAQSPDYVRQTQERLILAPILEQLRSRYASAAALEEHLRALLDQLRLHAGPEHPQVGHGYGPANVLALLRLLRGDLRGVDLSRLALQNVYLQEVEMQDATLAGAMIHACIFTEAFADIEDIALSRNGQYCAMCSGWGDVRLWAVEGAGKSTHLTPERYWQPTTDLIFALALSPDGAIVAGGGFDGKVKLWAADSGAPLWASGPYTTGGGVRRMAFSPDGRLLACSLQGDVVQLWDVETGMSLQTLQHPNRVPSLSWGPVGINAKQKLLATGDGEGSVRVWAVDQAEPTTYLQMLGGHKQVVLGLDFAPDGRTIASASLDGTVKLWEVTTGHLRATLAGQGGGMHDVAWSPDGQTLAFAGEEATIWLWDIAGSNYRAALRGHAAEIRHLAFMPNSVAGSETLLSSSSDGTLRVWNANSGHCVQIIRGHDAALIDVTCSPDGTQLVSAEYDRPVQLYDANGATPPRVLRQYSMNTIGAAWSPDGRLAVMDWVNAIHLCDPQTGEELQVLQHPTDPHNRFFGIDWSPDGQWLASGTRNYGVLVWDMRVLKAAGTEVEETEGFAPQTSAGWRWPPPAQPFPTVLGGGVYWSPDGAYLAGGGVNGIVYVWDAREGTLLQELKGHHSRVNNVAWSPDGRWLVSGSSSPAGGELFVWDLARGERIRTFVDHPGIISAVAWGSDEDQVISGANDGMLRWWNMQSGECVAVRPAHQGMIQYIRRSPDGTKLASFGHDGAIMLWDRQTGTPIRTLRRDRPYERLNITGIQGLTEAQKATLRALGAVEDAC